MVSFVLYYALQYILISTGMHIAIFVVAWLVVTLLRAMIYRIARNFDGFDAFQPDRQNLTRQILKAIQCLVKDTEHLSKYFLSNILSQHPSKVPPSKFPTIRYLNH